MTVHFNDTQPGSRLAGTFFKVITDYPSHPSLNPSVTAVTVLRKDENSAELLADRVYKDRQASARIRPL